MSSWTVSSVIEKLNARDKDERYMAMHDLAADLDRDNIKLDGEMERRVVAIILKHLEDTGTDVKQQAVRTIASLAKKVQQPQLEEIADKLATHILNKTDEEKRDIGSIGLKTLVGVLTQQTAPAVLKRVTPKLQQGIAMEAEVAHYCLEILNDLLKSFGMIMSRDLASIQSGILPMLSSPVAATRKRVSTCVASLAICAPDQLFVTLIGSIFNNIEASRNADQIRTYIQTIAGVSRSVGHRLGRELKRIIPLFMSFCEDDKYKEDTEMLENCLQAFESFVLRCPKEIGPHLDSIITTGIAFIKHDPNYADEEDEDEDLMDEDEPEDEFSDDGDYSGDDDSSWKVRTAAVKCLGAVIRTRPEMLNELYERVLPVLMARFREREEIVKMEVFSAFKDLLRQSQGTADAAGLDAMEEDPPLMGRAGSVLHMLDVDRVVKVVLKQLKDKSFKTKEKCLELLRELIAVLNGGLGSYLNLLIPDMERAIDKAAKTSLKVEALTFLCALLEKHPGADFTQHVAKLGPAVIASVSDCNYKISAVALRVCGRLTQCSFNGQRLLAAAKPFVLNMYTAVFSRLSSQDQDLEVKEAAIVTTGQIVATLGDILGAEHLKACLPVLLERLRNETTRVTSLKALSTIARSELKIEVSSISSDAVLECSSFLRKNDRALKQAALTTLTDLVASYSGSIGQPLYESVARELAPLVTDTELHLTHLVLQLCVCMVRCAPPIATPLVQQCVLPRSLVLLQSPLLQGPARVSLRSLFATLAASAVPGCGFQQLLDELLGVVKAAPAPLSRQSLSSIAQCISSLCGPVPPEQRTQTLQGFIAQLGDAAAPEQSKLLLLHAVGEIGKGFDLSGFALETVLMAALLEGSEDTKAAASLALGSLAMGSIRKFLPFILQQVAAQTEIRYLLLQALRQLITLKTAEEGGSSEGGDRLGGELPRVLELLMGQCGAEDEGVRSMVAECLGRLGLICPAEVLPRLQELVRHEEALTRATAVYALKFTITDKAPMAELAGCIADFLALLKDGEIVVRKAALTALNSSAHNKPPLIRPVLSSDWLLPALYGETAYKKELVRTVNLGPFQHKVDDGAELRKLALACMDTLLDKSADKLDTSLFLQHLQARLSDELDDIKQAAYQLLSKLAVREPFCVREVLDSVSEPLQAVLSKRPKESASPQDIERHNELQRSAIQTVVVLHKMPESSTCLKFQAMFDGILQDPKLKALVDSVDALDASSSSAPAT